MISDIKVTWRHKPRPLSFHITWEPRQMCHISTPFRRFYFRWSEHRIRSARPLFTSPTNSSYIWEWCFNQGNDRLACRPCDLNSTSLIPIPLITEILLLKWPLTDCDQSMVCVLHQLINQPDNQPLWAIDRFHVVNGFNTDEFSVIWNHVINSRIKLMKTIMSNLI